MPRDKTENHGKILEAAREEFLEMGYEEALSALKTLEKFFLPGWKKFFGG